MIRRALLSVHDKTWLAHFARGLLDLGVDLVASGGTAAFLEEMEIEVTRVEDLTEVPELLGGRVKTLHPRIHAGILARADRETDIAALERHGIEPFDLVCVNLYPFPEGARGDHLAHEEAVELIDVGGPALLRAAAKNHAHVVPVASPERYGDVLDELRADGDLSAATRERLAAETFAATAAYDAAIAAWFARGELFPERRTWAFDKVLDLGYGENPHQKAALYAERGARDHLFAGVTQLHGRRLSLINLLDVSTGRALLEEVAEPACAIVKHANPCGVAVGATPGEAFAAALTCDPVSAFGMACVVNRPVDADLGEQLADRFVDVVYAPGYDAGALEALRRKPATRILGGPGRLGAAGLDLKRVAGGLLVQEPDAPGAVAEDFAVVCGSVDDAVRRELFFAWRVCKHVTSNAIVVAREGRTIGIGSGQVSRVDAVAIALDKAARHGHDLRGAVLASDAFFPFADGPEAALAAGVGAIIQPGGSKRDGEVIAAVERAGAAMVFTGTRHFRH